MQIKLAVALKYSIPAACFVPMSRLWHELCDVSGVMQPKTSHKENLMKLHTLNLAMVLLLAGAPAMLMVGGCDREVSHSEQTKQNPDGSTSHKETTVKQDSQGNTVKETDKSKTPANP
jgi:hypothetical protein